MAALLSNDSYFDQYPERVLGEPIEVQTRYGREAYSLAGNPQDAIAQIRANIAEQKEAAKPIEAEAMPLAVVATAQGGGNASSGNAKGGTRGKRTTEGERESRNRKKVAEATIMNDVTQKALPKQERGLEAILSFDDIDAMLNAHISLQEKQAWVLYQVDRKAITLTPNSGWAKYFPQDAEILNSLVVDGYLCIADIKNDVPKYVPAVLYYAENIQDRMSDLRKIEAQMSKLFGEDGAKQYDRQMKGLLAVLPQRLRVDGSEGGQLILDPKGDFVKDYRLLPALNESVAEESAPAPKPMRILDAYREWLNDYPSFSCKEKFNATAREIREFYLAENVRISKKDAADESEKAEIRNRAASGARSSFTYFLANELSFEDRDRLEKTWNYEFNSYVGVDYARIPIGFQINKKFKKATINIYEWQREAVAFITAAKGSGHICYDVGLGKTLSACLCIADGVYSGRMKRPLVVVPTNTYGNWVSELEGYDVLNADGTVKERISGVLNGIEVIKLGNGGGSQTDILEPQKDGTILVRRKAIFAIQQGGKRGNKGIKAVTPVTEITFTLPESCVFLMTEEGLGGLGFNNETANRLVKELVAILSDAKNADNPNASDKTLREEEIAREKAEAIIGEAVYGAKVEMEAFNFDGVIFDEAHYYRNLFKFVPGGRYKSARGGEPSIRAVKAFCIARYLTQKTGGNIIGLTATPFNNNPLEVFTMLKLVAQDELGMFHLDSIVAFFDKFIQEEYDNSISTKGVYKVKAVVKSFVNLPVLQTVLFRYLNYKQGEDIPEVAKIRPKKLVLPLYKWDNQYLDADTQIITLLKDTPEQAYWQKAVQQIAKDTGEVADAIKKRNERGEIEAADLRIVSYNTMVALSPYALVVEDKHLVEVDNLTPELFCESSPKLMYTIACIESVVKYNRAHGQPVSGQVIYIDFGVDYFPLIAEYIASRGVLSREEIGFIGGNKQTQAQKENVKAAFNEIDGEINLVIGTSAMMVGINLQARSSVLYLLTLPWNASDLRQIEGRVHRQGNIHQWVRIVVPMLENSVDAFKFQTLYEKAARTNSLFSRNGKVSVYSPEELSPSELRDIIVTDPRVLFDREIDKLQNANSSKLQIARDKAEAMKKGKNVYDMYFPAKAEVYAWYAKAKEPYPEMEAKYTQTDAGMYAYLRYLAEKLNRSGNGRDRTNIYDAMSNYQFWKAEYKKISDIVEEYKQRNNVEDVNILQIYEEARDLVIQLEGEKDRLSSAVFKDNLLQEITEEIASRPFAQKELHELVQDFERTNHLLSCTSITGSACDVFGGIVEPTYPNEALVKPESREVTLRRFLRLANLQLKAMLAPVTQSGKAATSITEDAPLKEVLGEAMAWMTKEQLALHKQEWRRKEYRQELFGVLRDLAKQIVEVPTKRSENSYDSIVGAHYFGGATDVFVLEKDKEGDSIYTYTVLNGDTEYAELGYQSLKELLTNTRLELDHYWTPKPLRKIIRERYFHEDATYMLRFDEGETEITN